METACLIEYPDWLEMVDRRGVFLTLVNDDDGGVSDKVASSISEWTVTDGFAFNRGSIFMVGLCCPPVDKLFTHVVSFDGSESGIFENKMWDKLNGSTIAVFEPFSLKLGIALFGKS